MSPGRWPVSPDGARFPRVSGDEPGGYLQPGLTTVFSRVSGDEPTAPKGGVWHGQFSPCERG